MAGWVIGLFVLRRIWFAGDSVFLNVWAALRRGFLLPGLEPLIVVAVAALCAIPGLEG